MGLEKALFSIRTPLLAILIFALGACSSGSGSGSSDDVLESSTYQISGSIGDGPIVGANIVVIDADGVEVASGVSDQQAAYMIDIPSTAALPVTVHVTGGNDLVTQRAADFELVAMVNTTGRQTVNVSPLTTIAVKAAICRGAETVTGLNRSWEDMADVFNIGLDALQLGGPMTQVIDANNVETAVLANEALGELVRRIASALPNVNADQVVEILACDIANGSLDGVLASQVTVDDTRAFAVIKAAEAAIRLEVLVGRLNVDGSDSTEAMNATIRTIMPQISAADVNSIPLDSQAIDGALSVLVVMAGVIPDAELIQLIELLSDTAPSTVRSELSQIYDAAVENTLRGIADRMAVAN